MVQRLPAALQHVTERLEPDARTSSRPPASDPPQATGQRPRRDPSERRPGGQPGHQGHARAWLPVEAVDGVIPGKPERGSQCQHSLPGDDPAPPRQQVTEIPPVKPSVTAYPWHGLVCPGCGAMTRAAMPTGVSSGGFGPRVRALTGRTRGRTIRQLVPELRQRLRGGRAFVGFAEGRAPRRDLDQWSRRRRSDHGKPWGRRGSRERRKRGVGRPLAWNTAKSAHGPWRLRQSPALAIARLPRYVAALGRPSLGEA